MSQKPDEEDSEEEREMPKLYPRELMEGPTQSLGPNAPVETPEEIKSND